MQNSENTPATDPILNSALKVGAVAGAAGMLAGGVNAILRGSPTFALFSVLTGVNSALLGGSYWAVRATMIRALQDPETQALCPREKVYVSGGAGAVAGGFVALALDMDLAVILVLPLSILRLNFGLPLPASPLTFKIGKPHSALPGALVWGLVGISGQSLYNYADARHTISIMHKERGQTAGLSFWKCAIHSKWSPVTKLTSGEYEDMLRRKLLAVEADLAIANEEIARLEKMKIEQHTVASLPLELEG